MRNPILTAALGILVGAVLASIVTLKFGKNASYDTDDELHLGQTDFVNPLVDCIPPSRGFSESETVLSNEIEDIVETAKREGEVKDVGVYFRDLINGPSIHIDSQKPFIGASLLKVPILIAYYRKAQAEPGILDRMITYDPTKLKENRVQNLETAQPLNPGQAYPVRELLRRMIEESDNVSASLLVYTQPDIDIVASLKDMGVPTVNKDGEAWVTPLSYGAMFRILYNATYLGTHYSNEALRLLARAEFENGLVAGVEKGTPVAHKFGERESGGYQQFHDCGIVYLTKRPYLLCVMTNGSSAKSQMRVVAEISHRVFERTKAAVSGK